MQVEGQQGEYEKANKYQAGLLLVLLLFEWPPMFVLTLDYIMRWNWFLAFGILFLIPGSIIFIITLFNYIRNTFRNWQQFSNYNKAGFLIFWPQFLLYILFILKF